MTMVVSYRTEIEPAAVPIAGELRLTHPRLLRDIAGRTRQALAEARAGARGMSDEQFVDAVMRGLADYHLTSDELLAELGGLRISNG